MIVAHQKKIRHLFYSLLLILFSINMPIIAKAADIITTLPPLAGLVHWLKPDADVTCLLPANADPHHFQLSPRQVQSLQQNKLLIRSSQDDGHWPSLQSPKQTLDLWPSHNGEHEQHDFNHAWLNPHAVQAVLPKIARQLQNIYPEDYKAIQQNLELALTKSEQLWQTWQKLSQTTELNTHGVIMQHPSWANLFHALHIPIFNTLESEQHGHEYGPRKLEGALKQLQQHAKIRLIGDNNHSNRALLWLKSHHQSSTITSLDALGTCDESWVHLMQRNLDTLQP